MSLSKSQHKFIRTHTNADLTTVNAGHMLYHRLISNEEDGWFIKAFDKTLFTNTYKQKEAVKYLQKEAAVYDHLRLHDYPHIPHSHSYKHSTLLLRAHKEEGGWHWRVPKDQLDSYIADCIAAFSTLEKLPYDHRIDQDTTLEYLWYNSWGSKESLVSPLELSLLHWATKLTKQNTETAKNLLRNHATFELTVMPKAQTGISHHDARQSNIAWHPKKGTVLVDWSWASPGLINGDATMLLIDLHKSGHNVKQYIRHLNPTYASLMMYYWILRHNAESAQGNDIVRLHQLLSALAAFELLELHTTYTAMSS